MPECRSWPGFESREKREKGGEGGGERWTEISLRGCNWMLLLFIKIAHRLYSRHVKRKRRLSFVIPHALWPPQKQVHATSPSRFVIDSISWIWHQLHAGNVTQIVYDGLWGLLWISQFVRPPLIPSSNAFSGAMRIRYEDLMPRRSESQN